MKGEYEVTAMELAAPSETAIRAQLGRLLASAGLARSHRQAGLLSYLVEETLAGRGGRIKATSIAMDVFGRDESFDQQRDTIVRVEAGRLRKRLQVYYEEEGCNDPLRISIPKGTYQPVFTDQMNAQEPVSSSQMEASGVRGQARAAMGQPRLGLPRRHLLLAALALLLVSWWLLRESPKLPESQATAGQAVASLTRPFLMVMPFSFHALDKAADRLAFGLVESLIAKLAKLEGLSVMAHASILEQYQNGAVASIQTLRQQHGVTHVLRGSLEYVGGDVALSLQLVDTLSGETLWADREVHGAINLLAMEESLALRIADALSVQIQPDERTRLADVHSSNSEAWVLYRQGLIMLIPPSDMTRIETARQLFQRAQELDPQFSGGYAGESFSHSITVLFMRTAEPKEELALAVPLAQRAIEVDGEFAMGYAVLSFAQVMARTNDAALENAIRAVELQPGDAFTRFIYGMNLTIAGDSLAALPVLREAFRLDPMEPRTPYLNVLGIAQFSAGLYEESLASLRYNLERGGPRGPHMGVFLAAAMAYTGDEEQAKKVITDLKRDYPDFPLRGWLEHWVTDPQHLQKTISLLQSLGLDLG